MHADRLGAHRNIAAGCRGDDMLAHHAQHARGGLRRIDGVMHPAENEVAVAVIGKIGVKFANHRDSAFPVSLFVGGERPCRGPARRICARPWPLYGMAARDEAIAGATRWRTW